MINGNDLFKRVLQDIYCILYQAIGSFADRDYVLHPIMLFFEKTFQILLLCVHQGKKNKKLIVKLKHKEPSTVICRLSTFFLFCSVFAC